MSKKTQGFKVGERVCLGCTGGIALIDADVLPFAKLFKWRVVKEGSNSYVIADLPRFIGVNRTIRLHALVMYWAHRCRVMPGREIDHIDGNGLNNRRENLRFVTSMQNRWNQKKTRGTSKFKGVYFNKLTKSWHAQIQANKKGRYIGSFQTEEEAARAYDAKAIELFGQFARPNFPSEVRKGKV